MLRTLFAISLLLAACNTAVPGSSPQPTIAPPTATPAAPATVAPPTAAPTATPASTVAPCDPYYGECEDKYTPRPTSASVTPPAGTQIVIATATTADGKTYLVTPDGYSLYTFDQDSPGQSACNGNCAGTWPPFSVGSLTVDGGEGVSGVFGTITRSDGTAQVTYNDAPIYMYAGDAAAGDTNGDGIGDVWHLAAP
jgi:predicted lipoprotein with Yx(FWY)xxD motif